MIELRNSKRVWLTPRKAALTASIMPLQMRGPGESWADISPALSLVDGKYVSNGAPYLLEIGLDGGRRVYPDRTDRSRYLDLPAIGMFQPMAKSANGSGFNLQSEAFDIRYQLRRTRVGLLANIKSNPGFDRITLDVNPVGLDLAKLLSAKTGVGIPRPQLIDAKGTLRDLAWSLKSGQMELGFDLTGMAFPVLLKNATLDVSVGASLDDDTVRRQTSTNRWTNLTGDYVGNSTATAYGYGMSWRFTAVNIPAGATVSVAYVTVVASNAGSNNTVRSDLCCQSANNPGQIASYADHVARARTAPVAYDGVGAFVAGTSYQLPSIVGPLQAVIGLWGGTGDALVVFWEDKDLESDEGALRLVASWDHASYDPPALHVVYDVGDSTFKAESVYLNSLIKVGGG